MATIGELKMTSKERAELDAVVEQTPVDRYSLYGRRRVQMAPGGHVLSALRGRRWPARG